jgi:hypothetical protein
MKKLVLFLITGSQLCAFIGSFILATELFHHSLCGSNASDIECISRSTVATYMATFNLIMVFIPDLKMFGYISSLSVFFQFFALLAVFFYAGKLFFQQKSLVTLFLVRVKFMNWRAMVPTLSVVLYVFQRITFYLPIKSNYSKMTNFHSYYLKCMNSLFGYIFMFTLPCYFQFFNSSQEIVFQNFKSSFFVIEFFKIAYSIVIFLSNPINLFPIYNSIYSIKSIDESFQQKGKISQYIWKFLIRLVITLIGIFFGIFVKSFVGFCSFVGAFFFSFLGLVLPGVLLWNLLDENEDNKINWEKVRLGLVIGVGLGIFVVTSISSLYGLITSTGISV